jgi:hypothetical protein
MAVAIVFGRSHGDAIIERAIDHGLDPKAEPLPETSESFPMEVDLDSPLSEHKVI